MRRGGGGGGVLVGRGGGVSFRIAIMIAARDDLGTMDRL